MDFLKPFLRHLTTAHGRKWRLKDQEFVCRDELNKKSSSSAPLKVKKRVHFELKPLLQRDEDDIIWKGYGRKPGTQIKILMTKEEAARLLSKCKDGGILEFKDVANELDQFPDNRVHMVSRDKKLI